MSSSSEEEEPTMIYGQTKEEFSKKLKNIINETKFINEGTYEEILTLTKPAKGECRIKLINGERFGILALKAQALNNKREEQLNKEGASPVTRAFWEALKEKNNKFECKEGNKEDKEEALKKNKEENRRQLGEFITAMAAYCHEMDAKANNKQQAYLLCLIKFLLYCVLDHKLNNTKRVVDTCHSLAKNCGVLDDEEGIADLPTKKYDHASKDDEFIKAEEEYPMKVYKVIIKYLLPDSEHNNNKTMMEDIWRGLKGLRALVPGQHRSVLAWMKDTYVLCPSQESLENTLAWDVARKILSGGPKKMPRDPECVDLPTLLHLGKDTDDDLIKRVGQFYTTSAARYIENSDISPFTEEELAEVEQTAADPSTQPHPRIARALVSIKELMEVSKHLKDSEFKEVYEQGLNISRFAIGHCDVLQGATGATAASRTVDDPDQQEGKASATERTAPMTNSTGDSGADDESSSSSDDSDADDDDDDDDQTYYSCTNNCDFGVVEEDGHVRAGYDGILYCCLFPNTKRNKAEGKWNKTLNLGEDLPNVKGKRIDATLLGARHCLKDFSLLKFLGGGSFGKVFLMQHNDMPGLKVAVKMVSFNAADFKWIVRELKLMSARKSEHIAGMGAFFVVPELVFLEEKPYTIAIVSEVCPSTLQEYIVDHVKRLIEEGEETFLERVMLACLIVCQVLEGVLALQGSKKKKKKKKITHRDLKPANIVIKCNGKAQIIDFGVAREIKATQGTSDLTNSVGTKPYTPPDGASKSHDEYSCGVILCEIISGNVPFGLHDDEEKAKGLKPRDWWHKLGLGTLAAYKQLGKPLALQLEKVVLGLLAPVNKERMGAKEAHDMLGKIAKTLETKKNED